MSTDQTEPITDTATEGASFETVFPLGADQDFPLVLPSPEPDSARLTPLASADPYNRNADGTFGPGNQGGPGNPHAEKASAIRAAFLGVTTPDEMADVARAILKKAQGGNVQAAKLVLAYTLGEPVALDLVEKIERMENALVRSRGQA